LIANLSSSPRNIWPQGR